MDGDLRDRERLWRATRDIGNWVEWAERYRREDPTPWRLWRALVRQAATQRRGGRLTRYALTLGNAPFPIQTRGELLRRVKQLQDRLVQEGRAWNRIALRSARRLLPRDLLLARPAVTAEREGVTGRAFRILANEAEEQIGRRSGVGRVKLEIAARARTVARWDQEARVVPRSPDNP